MTSPSTYTARCWRDGDAWLVHVVELDEKVRVARLSQVVPLSGTSTKGMCWPDDVAR